LLSRFIGILSGFVVVVFCVQSVLVNEQLPFHNIFLACERVRRTDFPLILISLGSMIALLQFRTILDDFLLKDSAGVISVRFLVIRAFMVVRAGDNRWIKLKDRIQRVGIVILVLYHSRIDFRILSF